MNTTEINKKLAEFMGHHLEHPLIDTYEPNGEDFKYDSSWDWLMEVVEKIYSLDTYYDEYIDYNSSMFLSGKIELSTNIKHVYNACNAFIDWYNSNKG